MASEAPVPTPVADGGDAAGDPIVSEALQATSVEEQGRKLFVGNLNFETTVEDLKEHFGKFGVLSDAQIIFRAQRSMGYGFITFTTTETAQNAVAGSQNLELHGRTVNVEIAKPMATSPEARAAKSAARAARNAEKAARRKTKAAEHEAATADAGAEGVGETIPGDGEGAASAGRKKPKRKPKKKRTPANAAEGDASLGASGEMNGAAVAGTELANGQSAVLADGTAAVVNGAGKKNSRRSRANKKAKGVSTTEGDVAEAPNGIENGGAEGGQVVEVGEAKSKPKKSPRPFKQRGPLEGEASKTMIFVANLPYSMTDDGLMEVFRDFAPVSATVVLKKHGPGAGRSKGFGFVTLPDFERQQAALKLDGQTVHNRTLEVKVAVDQAGKPTGPVQPKGEGAANDATSAGAVVGVQLDQSARAAAPAA